MSELISKWILNRLGIIIDMTPENFALKTSNGFLLSQILKSYEIITPEELDLIKASDQIQDCYDNFQLINVWLNYLNLNVSLDDLYEIVHGVGTTSLHLFYQIFLEVRNKTKLDFLTENELNTQLGKQINRFTVKKVEELADPNKFDLLDENLCEPFLKGGDAYHWYKERVENLQTRCKDARDEYLHNVKNRWQKSLINAGQKTNLINEKQSGLVYSRGISVSPCPSTANSSMHLDLPLNDDLSDTEDYRNYEDLLQLQEETRNLPPFEPDVKVAKKILKNLHDKSKLKKETKILRNQLHQEIMNSFNRKINDSKVKTADEVLKTIFMKQSSFEKELISKVAQVKMFKEYMLENRLKQASILNNLKDKEFMDILILRNKEINEKKLTYYVERERVLELHKKIWEEKIKLRKKRDYNLCNKSLKDLVDISIKISEFKKRYGREPNQREMNDLKNLFISGQNIFEIYEPTINIIKATELEDLSPETILVKEMDRQNAIDDQEFEKYMNYETPWELENINNNSDVTEENLKEIDYGLNILGYIIHRAFQIKYPIVPLWEKPNFPDVEFRVCINGLNDTSVLPILQHLLSEKDIYVIELQQAVNFCIESYKTESKREYDEDHEQQQNAALNKAEKPKKEKPVTKKKGEKSSKKTKKGKVSSEASTGALINASEMISKENKIIQTPIKFPCEETPLSSHALLGKTAQELVDDGQPLGDFLIIDMFIEYLKTIPNLKGWVLVNYPTNFEQAAILEEALTGVKLVESSIKLNEASLSEILEPVEDECSLYIKEDTKFSKLIRNPIKIDNPCKTYDTILTAYIHIKKMPYNDKTGDAILPPIYEELGEETDPLERFYSNAGANYSMYYKEFDNTTIKYLGKLIIGDYTLPMKSSVQLFGDVADLDRTAPRSVKATKKGEKSKKSNKARMVFDPETETSTKTSTKEKTTKKGKKVKEKVLIVYENKAIQVPTEDEEEIKQIDYFTEFDQEKSVAGQDGWEYCNNDCPEELLIILATLWEAVEEIYINDLKQVFFLKRINLSTIMPFVHYVKNAMEKIINRPDYKGFYLSKFQRAFNSFEMNFRKDNEFKMEMHCRIEDFKEKLTEMSDLKMIESENLRLRIIGSEWTPRQIIELINDYINMFQIELDRYTESIRIINDYYMGIFYGIPSEDEYYKEELLPKIHRISNEIINNFFEDNSSIIDLSYFEDLISSCLQKAFNVIKQLGNFSANLIDKLNSNKESQTNDQNKSSKSKPNSPKSKESKGTKKTSEPQSTVIIKDNYENLLLEWQNAVRGETLRINLRLELLKFNSLQSIQEFLSTVQEAFHEVFNKIRLQYRKELENIEISCNVFRTAVENETHMQKELLFDEQIFCINPEINLFADPLFIPELPKEVVEDGAFTIMQLEKLSRIFLDLAPSGYVPKSTFIFILQDILWIDPDGSDWLSPKLWRQLTNEELKNVIDFIFDDIEYIYWKDFIVYNLRIEFPSERELLITRKALRNCDPDVTEIIQDYQFYSTKLWFEYAFPEENSKKIQRIKEILHQIYYIKNYGFNYTAMLLDFCKNNNSIQGFAKALELSIGKLICWNPEMGNLFIEEYLQRINQHDEQVRLRDEERADYYNAVYEEVSKLVDYVMHISEDVILEDFNEETEEIIDESKNVVAEEENLKTEEEFSGDDEETVAEFEETAEEEESQNSKVLKVYASNLPNNVETETDNFGEILFFLPLEVIITIITSSIPWHCRVQTIQDLTLWEKVVEIYEKTRNINFNTSVLAHEFLNSEEFQKLLNLTKKFKIIDPVRVVNDILSNRKI